MVFNKQVQVVAILFTKDLLLICLLRLLNHISEFMFTKLWEEYLKLKSIQHSIIIVIIYVRTVSPVVYLSGTHRSEVAPPIPLNLA